MDDPFVVRVFESFGNLLGDLDGLGNRHRPAREPLLQVFALDQFERDERRAAGFLEAVDRGDVRMVERGEQVGLAAEPAEALRVAAHARTAAP